MLDQDNILWSSKEVSEALGKKIGSSWYCTGLEFDSRKVKKGSIFLAFSGKKLDGHNYIGDAIKLGAVAVIVNDSFISEPGVKTLAYLIPTLRAIDPNLNP